MSNKNVTVKLSYLVWIISIIAAWGVFLVYAWFSHKVNFKAQILNFIFTVTVLVGGRIALNSQKITGQHEISAALLTVIMGMPYMIMPGCGTMALLVPLIYGFSGTLQDEYGDNYIYDIKQCLTFGITACLMIVVKVFVDKATFDSIGSKFIMILMNVFIIAGVVIQTVLLFYHLESTQEDLIENIDSVREEAMIDPLTGIQNRGMLNEVIEEQKSGIDTFSIIMLDVDHFKKVNDTYGHVFGDTVLKTLARVLVKACGENNLPFRYGGEEFIIICKNCDISGAKDLAEKIRKGFQNYTFDHEGKELHFTLSAGVSEVPYGTDQDPSEIIAKSDDALYEAKNTGRNKVVAHQD